MGTLDYLQHYNAVRIRVKGSGNLKLQLISLDSIATQSLIPVAMSATTNITPTKLANFIQPRAQLKISTTEIDETFLINQINIYVKPIFTSLPQ